MMMNYGSNFKRPIENDRKITTEGLIEYIKRNINKIYDIDAIDLNTVTHVEVNELKKLSFQDVRPVQYLPEIFNEIFDLNEMKYLHAGVLEKIPNYTANISLFSSVIVCVKQSFLSQSLSAQEKDIHTFIECLKNDSNKINYKKYGWEKNELYDCIQKGFIGSNIIKYLSDYLCINIFILNISEQKITFGGGDEYVPYRKSIFLIHHGGDSFEPLYTESGTKYFLYNDEIMKRIRSKRNLVKAFKLCENMDTSFVEYEENLNVYLHKSVKVELVSQRQISKEKEPHKSEMQKTRVEPLKLKICDDESNIEELMAKKPDEVYTLKNLKTMKIAEIKVVAESLKIDIKLDGKNKTKDQLICDIIKKS